MRLFRFCGRRRNRSERLLISFGRRAASRRMHQLLGPRPVARLVRHLNPAEVKRHPRNVVRDPVRRR